MMNQMMQETLLTGTARKAELPGWQAAGKTGTSQDWRDAWFLGYTSYLVAGVWLGNDDSSPTKKVSGGNLPVEIWSRFMKAAHEGVPVAALPLGGWRQGETPNPDASPTPPLNLTGAQMGTGGRGARLPQPAPPSPLEAFAPQPRAAGPRGASGAAEDGGLLPPAEIPNAGRGPVAHGKGLLDKLFGTP
jgi:penicillin-binding protein 1A